MELNTEILEVEVRTSETIVNEDEPKIDVSHRKQRGRTAPNKAKDETISNFDHKKQRGRTAPNTSRYIIPSNVDHKKQRGR